MIVLPFEGDAVILDTETTGLLKPSAADLSTQPYITEFYGMRINRDGELVDEFETFIKPPIPIPEETIKITGITDEMVKDAPSFIEVVDLIISLFLGAEGMVAHNLPFDQRIILHELERHDLQYKFPWPPVHHCTVELSRPIENKAIKLDRLFEIAKGRARTGWTHRAKQDVRDLADCYVWLVRQGFVK